MVAFRIIILIVSVCHIFIWLIQKNMFLTFISALVFVLDLLYIFMKDIDIKQWIADKKEIRKLEREIYLYNKNLDKERNTREYKKENYGIEINYKKLITFLLIVIILILLYNNGFFYKFTIVNSNNINDILISSHLTKDEKETLALKILTKRNNEIYGKMIWQLL